MVLVHLFRQLPQAGQTDVIFNIHSRSALSQVGLSGSNKKLPLASGPRPALYNLPTRTLKSVRHLDLP
jgi:hypothetical protein